jgi:hypothetical protein
MNAHKDRLRPEGPVSNRSGREAWVRIWIGRALKARHYCSFKCRAFGAPSLGNPYPGLTAGPTHCRPFGPE